MQLILYIIVYNKSVILLIAAVRLFTEKHSDRIYKGKIKLNADEHNNILVVYVTTVEISQMFVLEFLTLDFGRSNTDLFAKVNQFRNRNNLKFMHHTTTMDLNCFL